ncbi:armadillo-type protein [Mycena olivaceomarginata]|nr:armadillo-type protein [Mycena olivaceomarginata]
MPPLTRQDSRPSIYSWWSDSNSLLVHGPTINLHAAAKPLMRLMYYRQALDIIRQNRGSPLTGTILETYSLYFPWDYVSWATKAAILSELADRTESSEVEARAVVESPVFPHIVPMLESPHPRARSCSCRLLRSLARYKSIAPAVLELEPCEQLVFLLDNKHSGVICDATATLTYLSGWVDGAMGMVDAKVLDHVLGLLESPNPDTRESASKLVGNLACHESTAPAVLKLNHSVHLVSLLSGEYHRQALDIIGKNRGSPLTTAILETYTLYFCWDYVLWATKATILSELADRAESSEVEAHAVVDSHVFPHIVPMLESPHPQAWSCLCRLLRSLAQYKSIAPAVLELEPCEQLVFLLDNKHSGVICDATATLTYLSGWVDGAMGMVDAKVLDHVLRLLESPNPDTRESASKLVGNLACHESTAPAVLKLNHSVHLVSLLSGEYHRQALDIIRKNRGSPLTTAILETYTSYFRWDYVLWATKAAILSELADRAKSSEVEARAVVDLPVFSSYCANA